MAYNNQLAARVRAIMRDEPGYGEKEMFGGICFLLNGNMCCGITREDLMLRVGTEAHAELLSLPFARPMDFTGRSLKGMLYVSEEGVKTQKSLAEWVAKAVSFAGSLPARKAKAKAKSGPKSTSKKSTLRKSAPKKSTSTQSASKPRKTR